MFDRYRLVALAAFASLSTGAFAAAGTFVASGDEWQLSNSAYDPAFAAGTTAFVNDLAHTFSGSSYLFLTGNGNVPQSALSSAAAQFASLGKTVSYASSFDLATAYSYDAVFHFGQFVSTASIGTYVANGGNAYVSLGGGWWGTPQGEANAWNPVLAQFGLVAGSQWFPNPGFIAADVTVGPSSSLIWGYGQSIEKLTPDAASQSYVRGSFFGGAEIGLVGASKPLGIDPQPPVVPGVPEPASWALLIAGFGLVGAVARRRRPLPA